MSFVRPGRHVRFKLAFLNILLFLPFRPFWIMFDLFGSDGTMLDLLTVMISFCIFDYLRATVDNF